MNPPPRRAILEAERLTLGVLLAGVASLALSDFVSPFYWSLPVTAAALRLWRGPGLALSEMQASLIGWAGFIWVGLELALGRALIVAFTDFLLILSLAVTIEAPTPRNHLHRMLVGLFLVLAASVLTDSVLYVLPLTAFVWFAWRAAQRLHGLSGADAARDLPLTPARREAPWLALMLAIGAGLFFIAPRFEAHSLLQPKQPKMRLSGFSDQVRLGDFARRLDPTVVMRIEAPAMKPRDFRRWMEGRYWRVIALDVFDGRNWRRQAAPARHWAAGATLGDARRGRPILLYREASEHPWLALPDGFAALEDAPQAVSLAADGALRFARAPDRRLRLALRIVRRRAPPVDPAPPVRADRDTRHTPAALKRWAARFLSADAPDAALRRMAAELAGWRYDLNAPISDDAPLRSFLQLKRGHCELFATTLALAAREAGLPARVVNGYRGGEWNEAGRFWLIRQQHAHSWVEVWIDGAWRRFDPTPPSRWALTGVRLPALDALWESVRMRWYRYVLAFESDDRAMLARAFWRWLKASLATLAQGPIPWLAGAAAGVWLVWRRFRRHPLRWAGAGGRRALAQLDRWLARRGVTRVPGVPVAELPAPEGVSGEAWRAFIREWDARLYGEVRPWRAGELRRRLRALSRADW